MAPKSLAELERNPEFAKLAFSDQVRVRQRYFLEKWKDNPEYQALSEKDKLRALWRATELPPVFENPKIGKEALEIGEGIKRNDPNALGLALTGNMASTANQVMTIPKFIAAKIFDPLERAVAGEEGISGKGRVYETLYGSDQRKAREYFTTLMDKDARWAKFDRSYRTLGKVVGTVGDYAAFAEITAPIGGPVTAGLGMMAEKSTIRFLQSRGGQFLLKTVAPAAVEAGAEGLFEVGRTLVRAALPEGDSERVETNAAALGKAFGTGIAFDFTFNMALSMAPYMSTLWRARKGYKSSSEAIKEAKGRVLEGIEGADEEWLSLLRNEAAGRSVPDDSLARAPEAVKDRIRQIRILDQLAAKPDTIVPGGKNAAYVSSWTSGYSLAEVPEGFRLTPLGEPGNLKILKN
ncbi:MAG: hypothetical protein WC291_11585, partial [Thermodesulfovibrionales bacterium]